MHGFLVDEFLKKVGVQSSILFSPPIIIGDIPWDPADQQIISDHVRGGIVFFQKLQGPNTEALVRRLKQDGTLTVYGIGDYVPENQIPLLCDAVVCSSEDLADYYRGQGCRSVTYIPDPAEFWCLPERAQFARPISRGLKVCWVGSSNNWPPLEPLFQLFQEDEFRDFQLITISDHPQATLPWSPETVSRIVPECDLAVIPTGSTFAYQVKSPNRALLFMANGVPVVASPLRSYVEVIRHSWNGFLAHDLDGFRTAFRELRDPERRKSIAWNAYSSIAGRYDIDAFGGRWRTFFESLHGERDGRASVEAGRVPKRNVRLIQARADLRIAEMALRRGQLGLSRRLVARNLHRVLRRPGLLKEVAAVIRVRPRGFFLRWF